MAAIGQYEFLLIITIVTLKNSFCFLNMRTASARCIIEVHRNQGPWWIDHSPELKFEPHQLLTWPLVTDWHNEWTVRFHDIFIKPIWLYGRAQSLCRLLIYVLIIPQYTLLSVLNSQLLTITQTWIYQLLFEAKQCWFIDWYYITNENTKLITCWFIYNTLRDGGRGDSAFLFRRLDITYKR